MGIAPADNPHTNGQGGEIVDTDPTKEIERLKKKIKKLECVAGLRRKQKRGLKKQIADMRRGILGAYKAMYNEKEVE